MKKPRHIDEQRKRDRKADLGIIHKGKKELGLDDDNYRLLLSSLTGKSSAADLDQKERRLVIESMQRLGADVTPRSPGRRIRVGNGNQAMLGKVYALLKHMAMPISYAEATLKNMFKEQAPDKLEWATGEQLHKLIATLEYHKRRHFSE